MNPQIHSIHEIESVSAQRARKSIKKEFAIFEKDGVSPVSVWPSKKLAQIALGKLTPPPKKKRRLRNRLMASVSIQPFLFAG